MSKEICASCKTNLSANLAESNFLSNDRFMFCSENCFRIWESKSHRG
jgi:hypothetical protein